jgi:hypothetical protein
VYSTGTHVDRSRVGLYICQTDDENAMIAEALAFLRERGLRVPAMRSGSRCSEQTLIREVAFGVLADPRDLERLIQRSREHGVPLRETVREAVREGSRGSK